MSIIVSLFIFFFCLSLHACNARHFGVIDKDSTTVHFHFSGEVEEKVKLLDHLNSSIGEGTNIDGIADDKSHIGGATAQESNDSVKKLSGTEIFESSGNVSLLNKATSTEGSRRRALLVGSGTHQVNKGVDISNRKAQEEEVAVRDYDPPHQTPPIHNRKT